MNNLPPVSWFTDFWNSVVDEITKYLVQLSASAGSHYKTNIELKAGYRVELVTQLKYTEDGIWQWLLHTSDGYRIALLQDGTMDTTGFANVMIDGVPYAGEVLTEPAKLHTISFDCNYDTLVNVLMCKNDVTVFNDNILEILKVYDETNKLSVHLDFKQPPVTQFIHNLAQPLGSELWNGETVIAHSETGTPNLANGNALTVGKTYLVEIVSDSNEIFRHNSGSGWKAIPSNTPILVKSERRDFLVAHFNGERVIKSCTIKEASAWAEAVNIPSESYLPVTFDSGSNIWVVDYDLWNQPTIVTTGSEPPFSVVGDIKYNLEVGSSYEYKINVVGLTVGVLLLQFGDYNVTIDSSGNMQGVVNSVESSRLRLLVGSTPPSSGVSISIEVKRIVEVAQ